VAAVVDAGYATLHELQTVYGTEDLYDMVEMIAVKRHNDAVWQQAERARIEAERRSRGDR
jgi:hypothetical protein